ncbi:tRNA pseudouridine(38-40) synthase TruA [Bacillus badius]|uniref:tRNA pseudouridine synthase A n=1 Tax=Bacillus badius TaxID=1455 RepID=A0ABR5AQ01_BACBA|nr:tRNA pseudouridine(38-40) synthase TruA [Bacillus badius]KIL72054.1 tRNA pseudouridine synthase A [Bacillus badius]KIL76834.1 tRNA pseudouridine synthase A [Bacillus badius]KZR60583.1 tRNA pseudouridine(38,39,40) synthase TruA [Bacillus badius]MED4717636.1 tRNA pseudouridine(38-40) synthase TruA [Bacillus badius]
MPRVKCTIAYDGARFSGYQVQPNSRTVQEELEKALSVIHKGLDVKVTASGRTDAGVHAKGQVIHFDTPLAIPALRWPSALNSRLPEDIAVKQAEIVSESFHARFSAVGKEYRYKIYQEAVRDPFHRFYACHSPLELDQALMQKAARSLIGTYDFTSFCSAKTEVEDKVRTITKLEVIQHGKEMELQVAGSGFLYNMVRIIAGTLMEVGRGRIAPDCMPDILAGRDRSLAGKTAPAEGLYLWEVFY